MLKIRLMRIGAKKRPFYRVVVVDERVKRTGGYIELLGSYNPLTEPKDIKLKQDRIDHWIKQGAQLSDGYLRITGKAPQRPPRKPKKEKKEEPAAVSPQPSDKTEAPKEEPADTSDGGRVLSQSKDEDSSEVSKTVEEPATPAEEKPAEEKPAESEQTDEGSS